MTGDKMPDGRTVSRLEKGMSRLAGEPVLAAARVNVAGLITYRGLAVFIMFGSATSLGMTSSYAGFLGFILAFGFEYAAWAWLRPRGGPLQFGIAGGVVGVSATTVHVARANWWTGRPTKLMGSWPRQDVTMTRAPSALRRTRRFDLRLSAAGATSQLDLVQNRDREATFLSLFGRDAQLDLAVAPAATRQWGHLDDPEG